MWGKPFEYWAVLIGMSFYVATRDAEREAFSKRVGTTVASACRAWGLSPGLAVYTNDNETWAAVLIMGFGLLALDLGTAIIMDRDFIKEMIRKRLGGAGK
jgi:hypothetical protein